MGQFVIVVLGVASVLSPVIVLRLAVLVLGFQVLCLAPRTREGMSVGVKGTILQHWRQTTMWSQGHVALAGS
jgi:hypothetical protein